MRGRRGIPRPRSEAELNPYRARFAAMFGRLRRASGVRSYLAHSMTVTPQNLPEVADTVAAVPASGYSMMSFQPAARIGDDRRWSDDLDEATIDDVWKQIEAGVGDDVAWQAVQIGDPRCNRTAFGRPVDGAGTTSSIPVSRATSRLATGSTPTWVAWTSWAPRAGSWP